MNRWPLLLFAPEIVVGIATASIVWLAARHSSYSTADVRVIERLLYLVPLLFAAAGFGTLLVPGHHAWHWLVRTNLVIMAGILFATYRLVESLGAPGSGPKGQEAAFILVLAFGLGLIAIGNAASFLVILRTQKPAFEAWYQLNTYKAWGATVLSVVPLFIAQLVGFGLLAGIAGIMSNLARR